VNNNRSKKFWAEVDCQRLHGGGSSKPIQWATDEGRGRIRRHHRPHWSHWNGSGEQKRV